MSTDAALLAYVQQAINSGATRIAVPKSLVEGASREALETVRQLCKLNGVKIDTVKEDRGGCYLTTACVNHAGLPDNCFELRTLRGFRDNYVRHLPDGPALLAQYYWTAPRIVAAIHRDPAADEVLRSLLAAVRSAVALIEGGHVHAAVDAYRDIHRRLSLRYGIHV